MKSIRTFLIIIILSAITLIAFIAALHGYRDSMDKAEQLFDSELVDKAQLLSLVFSLENIKSAKPVLLKNEGINSILENNHSLAESKVFAYQIWQGDQLLLRSAHIPETPIAQFKQGFQDINFLNHRWRTYSYYNQPSDRWILTAERMDIRYVLAENIVLETILPVVLMLPVLGFIIWTIVSYGLSPLRHLSQALSNKRADDLTPLSMEKQPVELNQVVTSINDLLHRLKVSFLREKHFASDAAHELRTPISAIKIHLHNLSKIVSSEEHSFAQLESSVERMEHLVEQILNLNRTSPEQYITHFTDVDIYNLAQEIIAREYHQFEKKNLQIELQGEHCPVSGDNFALDVLLQNLLTNACKYTPENGSVLVSVIKEKNNIKLQVQDSGPGVPEEQYERLFDRFYRLNGDRHASGTTGCGLGLAIVKQIVELHNARVTFGRSTFPSGLSVTINFPVEGLQ